MYKNKYLKYKSKYLQLLKQLGGDCDKPPNNDETDYITNKPLTNYKPEHTITIGDKCWTIKSAFLYYILQNNAKIFGTNVDLFLDDKSKIITNFKLKFYKLYFYTPLNSRNNILAVKINDLTFIPFDDFYQEILIDQTINKRLKEVDIWTRGLFTTMLSQGSLVIIRNLLSFTEINNSLGIIVKVLSDDKYEILLLYPDNAVIIFRQKHKDKNSNEAEKKKYNDMHGIYNAFLQNRFVIILSKDKLELL